MENKEIQELAYAMYSIRQSLRDMQNEVMFLRKQNELMCQVLQSERADEGWKSLQDEMPAEGQEVQLKAVTHFTARYEPHCKLAKWISAEGQETKSRPIAWRPIKCAATAHGGEYG